jgi:uncharacterized integral membrane protein
VLGAAATILLLVVYWPALTGSGTELSGFGWPRVILFSLIVLSLLLAVLGWLNVAEGQLNTSHQSLRMPALVALIGSAFLLGLYYLGFVLATFIFAVVLPRVLGRPWREAMIFSFGLTGTVWLFLIKLLNAPLPKGTGLFHSLSVWLI